MSIDITFTLSNADLQRFEEIVSKAKERVEEEDHAEQVEKAAAEMIEKAQATDLPQFIEERLVKIETLLNMVRDQEWRLDTEDRQRILSALSYFSNPADMIPDDVPGVGYLDDAIYTEIIIRELDAEVKSYNEFCQYRIAEENRRRNRGLDPNVGREDWLADKRSVLHSRMRARRAGRSSSSGWRNSFF